MIKHIGFLKPVPITHGQTISYWALAANGKTSRVERCDEGIRLIFGQLVGPDDWRASGDVATVPFANIASILEGTDATPSPDPVTPRARGKSA